MSEPDQEAIAANARLLERRKQVTISLTPTNRDLATGHKQVKPVSDDQFNAGLENLLKAGREAKAFADQIEKQIKESTRVERCSVHGIKLFPNLRASVVESRRLGRLAIAYHACAQCFQIEQGLDGWKVKAGIPEELFEASLDNWTPRNDEERKHLAVVKKFQAERTGFLIMLGNFGTGKTHLAAALILHQRRGLLITQADLLTRLRTSYGDNRDNVIASVKKQPILCIDEMGLSGGGRDEFPMLHQILSHRHANYLPTVLTGNITPLELAEIIGERMVDRLSQSLCRQLIFTGSSNRPARRNEYQQAGQQKGQ